MKKENQPTNQIITTTHHLTDCSQTRNRYLHHILTEEAKSSFRAAMLQQVKVTSSKNNPLTTCCMALLERNLGWKTHLCQSRSHSGKAHEIKHNSLSNAPNCFSVKRQTGVICDQFFNIATIMFVQKLLISFTKTGHVG